MIKQIEARGRSGYRRVRSLLHRWAGLAPSLKTVPTQLPLVRLGSGYGGWTFVDRGDLQGAVVVSCGLGEDASFDVEFAARYGARLILVDPTPRAVRHFAEIQSRIGRSAERSYARSGCQPPEAYELRKVAATQLQLCAKALWREEGVLRFFAPADPTHVSFSIVNYQNAYSQETPYIDVPATTVDALLSDLNLAVPQLLKLDIEGAEVEVLIDMVAKRILPPQILIEYDELSVPSRRSKTRIESAHRSLTEAGYVLVYREHTNFTYIRFEA